MPVREVEPADPQAAAFARRGQVTRFVWEEGGSARGEITASVDDALADRSVGCFGELRWDDEAPPGAGPALLGRAEAWVRGRGRRVMHGPVRFTIWHGYRAQLGGFERPAHFAEPRNRPALPALLAAAGYRPAFPWRSFDLSPPELGRLVERLSGQVAALGPERERWHIEPLLPAAGAAELAPFHDLVMACFERNYGFTPLPLEEFAALTGPLWARAGPESLQARDERGELAGIVLSLDEPPPSPRVAYLVAIRPAFHKAGLAQVLMHLGYAGLQAHGGGTVAALVKEGRSALDSIAAPSRHYAVFAKEL
jgi:hypothetical protein